MKTYLTLSRNEKVEAGHLGAHIVTGQTVFLHIERWNGSYEIDVNSTELKGDKVVLVDNTGQKHIVSATMPVWIRERELIVANDLRLTGTSYNGENS
jgi:hypothetical protein